MKIPVGTGFGSYGVACVLSVVGGGLTLFAGSFVLSDAFFSQLTSTGVIMTFLGGLLFKRSKWAIFLESRYYNRLIVRLVFSSWGSQIRSAC